MRRCEGQMMHVDERGWVWEEAGTVCLNRAAFVIRPGPVAVCLEHVGAVPWMRDAQVIEFLGLRA